MAATSTLERPAPTVADLEGALKARGALRDGVVLRFECPACGEPATFDLVSARWTCPACGITDGGYRGLAALLGLGAPGRDGHDERRDGPGRNGHTPNPVSTDSTGVPPCPAVESNRRFRSPAEVLAAAGEEIPWLWRGYLAPGSLTFLGGREKAGKSTLSYALIGALVRGEAFLAAPTTSTGAVLLSEEPDGAVAEKLRRFGLENAGERLRILARADVRGRPALEKMVGDAVKEARRVKAGVLVVDTLTYWAHLPTDAENDAGAMQEALRPLQEATAERLAVWVLHHLSKSTNELRGSTAIGAGCDIILKLLRASEARNRRRLDADSRYQATPDSILLELLGDTYRLMGAPEDVKLEVLHAMPQNGDGATQDELEEATGLTQQRVAEALHTLQTQGRVERSGKGVRGNAYRYRRAGLFDSTGGQVPTAVETVETDRAPEEGYWQE